MQSRLWPTCNLLATLQRGTTPRRRTLFASQAECRRFEPGIPLRRKFLALVRSKGVFSHQTALALHELSDVLPATQAAGAPVICETPGPADAQRADIDLLRTRLGGGR